MRFTKMEGLGNDYVYLDCIKEPRGEEELPELARKMSDRHFGIGGDGIICLFPSEIADFKMRMFNADGSEGEMCGNGIRCLSKFAYDLGYVKALELRVETLAGVKGVRLTELAGEICGATVDMGEPEIGTFCEMEATGKLFKALPVSMGNPHAVIRTTYVNWCFLHEYGPILERDPKFPDRVNVELVEVLDRKNIRVRVWERGSGETLACGTGACAAAVAMASMGLTEREVTVELRGGNLHIRWDEASGHVFMTGPARTVFTGEWPEIAFA